MDDRMIDERMIGEGAKLVRNPWDLNVFKLAYDLSLSVHKQSLDFPKIEQYALANQLRRSSKSICANIAEGFNRQKYSRPEFARYIAIAEASACESQMWCRYALDLGYIEPKVFEQWADQFASIAKMLAKLHGKLQ